LEPQLPPCGLYRTRQPVGTIPEGRLVYFHNHGEPGPGIYLPTGWRANRASFDGKGHVITVPDDVSSLEPLPREGLYRVATQFHCCEKRCRLFEPEMLVQLGYDRSAAAILFVPEWMDHAIAIPEQGTRIDRASLEHLIGLKLGTVPKDNEPGKARTLH